jgi:RNA polymerase sigma-B factor
VSDLEQMPADAGDENDAAAGGVDVGSLDERTKVMFGRMPDPGAREELVVAYRALAEYLARRFAGRGEPLDDLIQVASIGLLKAIDRFDLGRGVKFSTYATPTIVGELKRHFRDRGWAMRIPRRLQEIGLQLRSAVPALSQDLGRSPTISEIADRTGLTIEEVLEGMDAVHAYSLASLDAPANEDDERGRTLRAIGVEDETLELLEAWASVAPHLRELPDRERRILYLRFIRGMTQSQVADELGISQMHVSRLLTRVLVQLRSAVGTQE